MKTACLTLSMTLAFVMLPAAAWSQETGAAAPLRLTLEEALARGVEASHRLAEARARQDAANAAVDLRTAADRPELSLMGGYMRTNHVDEFSVPQPNGDIEVLYPDVPDNYRTRLDFQWPIYTGGRSDALVRAAAAEAKASASDVSAARSDLRLEITRAFWAYLTAQEAERVVDESHNRMEAHVVDLRNRLSVGLISPGDVMSGEARASRERMFLIEARNVRQKAAADLCRLIGVSPDTTIALEAALDRPAVPPDAVDALVIEAKRNRPDRDALEQRISAASERTTAAAAGRRPMVAVAAGYDYASPNPRIFPREEQWQDSWDAGVNVSWSLWDGGRVRAATAEATAESRAAEQRLAEFDSVLEVDVRQRRLDIAARQAAVGAASDSVRSAAEARRVAADRFNAGVATNTEVLDAQIALLEAELDRTMALAGVRLAEAQLDRTLGR